MDTRIKKILIIFALLSIGMVIAGRLFYLQIIKGEDYTTLSENNYLRIIEVTAPRGNILNSKGEIIAHDFLTYVARITPADIKDENKLIELLQNQLGISRDDILKTINDNSLPYFYPRVVAVDIPMNLVLELKVKEKDYPGLSVDIFPVRKYDKPEIYAHITGYVHEINQEELSQLFRRGYSSGDRIGKTGVEKYYEDYLRGTKGKQIFKVDAQGQERIFQDETSPAKGNDLTLTIVDELQTTLYEIMKEIPGGAILMNPNNGEILAMVSSPSFDPNYFVKGLTSSIWNQWQQGRALVNRILHGQYPPGSTFKALLAISGLEEKSISDTTTVNCQGYIVSGRRIFKCWTYPDGHGPMNMRDALAVSCNVYFYTLGGNLGVDNIVKYANKLGFGQRTGIDLPNELTGLLPGPTWKQETIRERWYAGDTTNLSIGQGYLLTTPLQIATFYSLLVNGGHMVTPHIVKNVRNNIGEYIYESYFPPIFKEISQQTLQVIKEGLRKSVTRGGGLTPLKELPIEVAAKTGTAQTVSKEKPHLWLAAYAPAENPEVVAIILSERSDMDFAYKLAPYMKRILEAWIEYQKK